MMKILNAAGTIFERKDGKILLLYRSEFKPEGEKWGLVGGKAKKGEIPLENAVREISEEIHFKVNARLLKHIGTFKFPWNYYEVVFDAYKYKLDHIDIIKLLETENTDFQCMKPGDAFRRKDLMIGLYEILKKTYHLD